jgi:hypothetical protein
MPRDELMEPRVRRAEPGENRARGIAFSALSFLFGGAALGGLFGIGLVIGWFDTTEGGIHRVHDLGFGILYGILVGAAFFVMIWRPLAKGSVLWQVVAAAVAVIIAALVSTDVGYLTIGGALLVSAAVLLALHPARPAVLRARPRFSSVMTLFVLVAAVPLVWFALTVARLQREGSPLDPHVQQGHWTTMASMAFGLVTVGLLAAARLPGWRFTAWCAGLGAGTYGVASIVFRRFPGTDVPYAGSEGVGWGLLAIIGGIAFIAVAAWEARRSTGSANSRTDS